MDPEQDGSRMDLGGSREGWIQDGPGWIQSRVDPGLTWIDLEQDGPRMDQDGSMMDLDRSRPGQTQDGPGWIQSRMD